MEQIEKDRAGQKKTFFLHLKLMPVELKYFPAFALRTRLSFIIFLFNFASFISSVCVFLGFSPIVSFPKL